MKRDSKIGKVDYELIHPRGIKRTDDMMYRYAQHLSINAGKYGGRNWETAKPKDLQIFRSSARRHFEAYMYGETDEDHLSALLFNLNGMHVVNTKTRYEIERAKEIVDKTLNDDDEAKRLDLMKPL